MHSADVNVTTSNQETPLYVAASYNRVNVVEILLNHGADPNIMTDDEGSPIWIAANNGHFSIVNMLLLHHKAKIHKSLDSEYLWLHVYATACQGGYDANTWDMIVEGNYNIDVTNFKHETPLYAAVHTGHVEATRLLIKFEPDVNVITEYGDSPLQCAIRSKNIELLKLLLHYDDNITDIIDFNNVDVTSTLSDIETKLQRDEISLFTTELQDYYKRYRHGSRQWIHNQVSCWLDSDKSSCKRVFWLKAGAGSLLHFVISCSVTTSI